MMSEDELRGLVGTELRRMLRRLHDRTNHTQSGEILTMAHAEMLVMITLIYGGPTMAAHARGAIDRLAHMPSQATGGLQWAQPAGRA